MGDGTSRDGVMAASNTASGGRPGPAEQRSLRPSAPNAPNLCHACGYAIAACEQDVTLSDQVVHVHTRAGSEDTVVWLVHGLGDSAETWRRLFTAPILESWELIAPDLPGFGSSPPISSAIIAVEELAASLRQLIERVTPSRRVAIVGHSLGGVLATLLAEEKPEWLVAVANIEGNLTADDCFLSGAASDASDPLVWFSQLMDQVRAQGARHGAMRCYSEALAVADRETFFSCSRDLVRLCKNDELFERYHSLAVPKLYCHGDTLSNSTLARLDQYAEARERFTGAGHWVQLDASDALSDRLAAWLSEPNSEGTSPTAAGINEPSFQ